MKKIYYVMILLLLVPILFGQNPYFDHKMAIVKSYGLLNLPRLQVSDGVMNERMEMMMTWKLTNDLDLTPEQADKFFPRFKAHRENMEKIENEAYKISDSIRNKIDKEKEISTKEFEDALNNLNELEIKKIEERERFLKEMGEYLSTNQLAKLALFKHYFMKDLRKEIRKRPRGGA